MSRSLIICEYENNQISHVTSQILLWNGSTHARILLAFTRKNLQRKCREFSQWTLNETHFDLRLHSPNVDREKQTVSDAHAPTTLQQFNPIKTINVSFRNFGFCDSLIYERSFKSLKEFSLVVERVIFHAWSNFPRPLSRGKIQELCKLSTPATSRLHNLSNESISRERERGSKKKSEIDSV